MPLQQRHLCGFSLVELSIVLVILGLLVGGILTGRNMIKAAELRSITTDYDRYTTAIHTFRDKYIAVPGDMANATNFWGADPNGCPTHTTRVARKETCNGNGNAQIGDSGQVHEVFRAWQHLANAGLVEGMYTGITGASSAYHSLIGDNVPRSKISNAGFSFSWYHGTVVNGVNSRFGGNYGNPMYFGRDTSIYTLYVSALTPEEMWNLDTKMDDGKPGAGKLVSFNSTASAGCASTDDPNTAAYVLTNTSATCSTIFKDIF